MEVFPLYPFYAYLKMTVKILPFIVAPYMTAFLFGAGAIKDICSRGGYMTTLF
jgi:hypothetical protein